MRDSLLQSPATLCLLVLNVGVSLLAFARPAIYEMLALRPFRMTARNEYHQIITSGFVHVDYMHLFINMLTLFFFGPVLESLTLQATGGRAAFLFIYTFSLVAGSLYPLIKYRRSPEYGAVGASGAISGVVFAFCLYDPLATLRVFYAIPMPAFLYAILYVIYSVYSMRNRHDNIGHEAHLGGAVGGIIATLLAAPQLAFFLR